MKTKAIIPAVLTRALTVAYLEEKQMNLSPFPSSLLQHFEFDVKVKKEKVGRRNIEGWTKKSLSISLVQTGEETYQKAWKEGGGKCQRSLHQTLFKASWTTFIVADSRNQEQGYSFTAQCETTGKEDKDESRSK